MPTKAASRLEKQRKQGQDPVMNVLLVYPRTPDTFWSFKYALRFISKRSVFPPLGLLTVAAMLPRSWNLRLVDLNVRNLRDKDIAWADYVMLSAMLVQKDSAAEVVQRCRAAGKPVIGGGPLFTTGGDLFGDQVHYVAGEAEELIGELVADMEAGTLKRRYEAKGWPDVRKTPVPRWDLINPKHYVTMAVQFSRGCPFNCEFCDIIVMNGRVPRTKTPEQMIAELEALRRIGWKEQVFVVDDNFIGNKKQVKELLRAIIRWRAATGSKMGFFTEASINMADDPELLELMAKAGFRRVFVGIETPVPESLQECSKHQNARRDMEKAVRTIQSHGMEVMGGFIVGFDNDPLNIFQLQYDFIQRTGIATAMVGLLTALPRTRLYQRLVEEGRLIMDATGNNTQAFLNFIPKLDREYLLNGYRQLMKSLYEPESYYQRVLTFLSNYRPRGPRFTTSFRDFVAFLKSLWLMGVWYPGRIAYWRFFFTTLMKYPSKITVGMTLAVYGHHFRMVAQSL